MLLVKAYQVAPFLTFFPPRSLPNICKEKPPIKHAWRATDEDMEKFQREILSDEPSLIKLYLQQRGDRWGGIHLNYLDSTVSLAPTLFLLDHNCFSCFSPPLLLCLPHMLPLLFPHHLLKHHPNTLLRLSIKFILFLLILLFQFTNYLP